MAPEPSRGFFRSKAVTVTALVVTGAIAAGCGSTTEKSAAPERLVVATYGGEYEETLKANAPEFEAKNNVKIEFVPVSSSDVLAKVRAGEDFDVVHLDPIWSLRGEAEGLFAPLSSEVTHAGDLYDIGTLSKFTVIPNVGAYGIAYNPDLVKPAPDSWLDLFAPAYKGKIAMRGFRPDSIELMVLMAKLNGGDERNIDPGFRKMAELGKNVHSYWNKHPEVLELFRRKEIAMSVWTDGRVAWANKEGVPVKFVLPKEGSFPLVSTVNVIKGSKQEDVANRYVNFLLSPKEGETMAEKMGYFPTNKKSQIKPEVLKLLAYTPENIDDVVMADWSHIVTQMDNWQERWDREVTAR
jgi:putative spermidine/putrescine transport system substrate-binding protein